MTTTDHIASLQDLQHAMAQGLTPRFLPFWGHQPAADGSIGKTCMSQWFEAGFEVEGQHYPTAEHFMMAGKARLFGDEAAHAAIVRCRTPGEAKKLGRGIQGFDEAAWVAARMDIVVRANEAKFSQNPALARYLLNTGDRVLVEASPVDAIWGIGLAADDVRATDPARWQGLNLLGFALMQVRARLRSTAPDRP
ncbi:conserved hypothetical protein [Delftia acidovorans SPH-1]|uniref:NADAR domain-containing protein n=2 Tax=Delftia acidovorans TaxID=80866 RepID=A9C0S6_DELAS|nr:MULTISPECIES: NADAR family protein [Delftia]MCP4019069.1 NADAR family protein [Delftia sp.]OLE95361.1 MAG: hypothetical protein AUI84_04455 [Delftia sp. 13_1_40CM_3_66_6]ABX38389.1 conserved hypothetical protein [Delftia acidovorans SPH-1]MBN9320980.1 NADAR family protein [Delftia acidovorans]MCP4517806.1 NADAR family protein [Delftia sp.]